MASSSCSISLILIIAALVFFTPCQSRRTARKTLPKQPTIWLYGFVKVDSSEQELAAHQFKTQAQFRNDFIRKNGSGYVVFSDVSRVRFVCTAAFPVRWTIPFPQHFVDLREHQTPTGARRMSTFDNPNKTEPANTEFSVQLEVRLSEYAFLTGNYTCEATDHGSTNGSSSYSNSIYLFVEGGQKGLPGNNKRMVVNMTEKAIYVILPCRPVLPDVSVELFKEVVEKSFTNQNKTTWVQLHLNSSISFTPKVGFTLKTHSMPGILGVYKCVQNEESELHSFFEIRIGDPIAKGLLSFSRKEEFKLAKGKVIGGNSYVDCCSGRQDQAPKATAFHCNSEQQCDIMKRAVMYDLAVGNEELLVWSRSGGLADCATLDVIHNAVLLICQNPEVEVATEIVWVYLANRTAANDIYEGNGLDLHSYNGQGHLHDLFQSAPATEEKIQFRLASLAPATFFVESSSTLFALRSSFYDRTYGEPISTTGDERGRGVKFLEEYTTPEIFEGEKLHVICYALTYFYAYGGWLRLRWKNGTQMILNGITNSFQGGEVAFAGGFLVKDAVVVAELPQLDLNMDSIDCFAPVWNTNKWEKLSYKLNVHPSVAPKLVDAEDKEIHLEEKEVADSNLSLNCTLADGHPLPNFTWEKNGIPIEKEGSPDSDDNIKIVTEAGKNGSSLHFVNITMSIQGEYRCIFENRKGKASTAFKIMFGDANQEPSGLSDESTTIVILSVTLTVLVGLIVGYILWKYVYNAKK